MHMKSKNKYFKKKNYCAQGGLPKDLAFRILDFLENILKNSLLKYIILTFGQDEFGLLNSWNLQ